MAWDDPAPARRARASNASPASNPGYGGSEVRLSFTTIVGRALGALLAGGVVYAGVHAGVLALLGRPGPVRHPALAVALPAVVAIVAGWLLLRAWLRRPESDVRRGGGWFGRRRTWDDGYASASLGDIVVADVVGDLIEGVVDAALD